MKEQRRLLLQIYFWVTFLLVVVTTNTFAQEEDLLEKVINELIVHKREFDEQQLYQPDTDEDASDEGEWVIKVNGGLENALKIANETNTNLQRPLPGFHDIYVFERVYPPGWRQRHKRSSGELASHFTQLNDVQWAEHQREKRRTKRQMSPPQMGGGFLSMFNDPLWPQQWQMHNFNTSKKGDMRIIEAWGLGVTGRGVVVSILDDGIDHQHPDLAPNYDPRSSFDLNDNDNDPMPSPNEDNKHGTRCAGEVAMVANNGICGVGIAWNAKIAGVRMLDGRITDRLEGEALSLALETVDIYSASWGPNDDGKTVEGPGRLALLGLIKGIKYGRNGKGAIYVWASGNGGMNKDDCNCDGYTSSLFSFSVASAAEDGTFP
uniref:Uncharacterized protein n=1 Tax=Panagrolaimus sp. ES5 TaxID=591445 RepID=A0AC34G6W8_9BILA